jgi:hypothetical protein
MRLYGYVWKGWEATVSKRQMLFSTGTVMRRANKARSLVPTMQRGKRGEEAEEEHLESNDIDEQLAPVGAIPRRTSARMSPGVGKGASSSDGRSGVDSSSEAIGLVSSLFAGVPATELVIYNVEGRGSCAPLALAASIGLAIPHAGVAADSMASKISKVTSAERYMDILLRVGAYQILMDHFDGSRIVSSKTTMKSFGFDRMHPMLKCTTNAQEGEWVSHDILQVMAAFIGLRFLYVINTEAKTIIVTKIDYSGDHDEDLTKFHTESFSWEEWKGDVSYASRTAKKDHFKKNHDTIHETGSLLDRTFSVLLTSGLSNLNMHYVALRPREDNKVPFRRSLDNNIRGRTLREESSKRREEQELAKLIGKHMYDVRKKLNKEPDKTWQQVSVGLVDDDDDDEEDDDDDDDDDDDNVGNKSAKKRAAAAADDDAAAADDDDDDNSDDASGNKKRAKRGTSSASARSTVVDKEGNDKKEEEPGKAKSRLFSTPVFAVAANHVIVVDGRKVRGQKDCDQTDEFELNTEYHPDYVNYPYRDAKFAELPPLAQWAATSLGWTAASWDKDSYTPKRDYSASDMIEMPDEIRALLDELFFRQRCVLDKDVSSLTSSFLIKKILGYSPMTWPGPKNKFGDFDDDIVLVLEVVERVWLMAARTSSDLLPGLTRDQGAQLALESEKGNLFFEDNFYSDMTANILFGDTGGNFELALEENFYDWARTLLAVVIQEAQQVFFAEEQELNETDQATMSRLENEDGRELTKGNRTGRVGVRTGLRHSEQRSAISEVIHEQDQIVALMYFDEFHYLVWMQNGATIKVPSSNLRLTFTKLFRDKLQLNPKKKFKVPVGHREKSPTELPTEFLPLPAKFVAPESKECVGLAVALGLHIFGDVEKSDLAKQHAKLAVTAVEKGKFANEVAYFKFFFKTFAGRHYTLTVQRMLSRDALLKYAHDFPGHIMIINPIASDGHGGHAVCVFKNLILDSAETRAMPLEQQWLDRCVRANAKDTATFDHVREALILAPTARLLKGVEKRSRLEMSIPNPPKKARV